MVQGLDLKVTEPSHNIYPKDPKKISASDLNMPTTVNTDLNFCGVQCK